MSGRFSVLASLALAAISAANAQNILTCQATVNPILVRGEGLTERMGDILLQCTGGSPGAGLNGNLTVFLSVPMTNRIDSNGYSDLSLTIDSGFGPLPANAKATYLNPASLSFSGLAFNLSSTGAVSIRLSNLRGAANQAGVNSLRQITASLSFNAGALISLSNNVFSVATVVRSLYSSYTSRLICTNAATPPIDTSSTMSSAIANRAPYATIRVTEGFNSAFGPRSDPNFQKGDFGSRFIVRYSGVPAGAHIFIPDGVVGTDGLQPTSAGDYGLSATAGTYSPGNGSLLLLRIASGDIRGAGSGSNSVIPVPSTTTFLDTMSEVVINGDGTGQAVYEVFDANQFSVQSATIPSFLYTPAGTVLTPAQIIEDVVLGPTSSTLETNSLAIIPRFVPVPAPNDCSVAGDCGANYFPKLSLSGTNFDISMTSLDAIKTQYFTLGNSGGGNYLWNASVRYTGGKNGSYNWLQVTPTAGINRETIRFDLIPGPLTPGIYDALIVIDGGPIAGTAQVRVTLRLSYQAPTPVVINAVNAANLKPGFLIPGSAAAILGDRLLGSKVSVMFDNSPARVLSSNSASRLDVQIPYDLAGKEYALIVVTVDGSSSTPGLLVPIGVSAPAIYKGSILNSDNTGNNSSNGAAAGSTIQVYATGLPVAGVYTGQIHDRIIDGDNLVYAGPAPTLIGVQLVKMIVPADLPSITTAVAVCGGVTADTQTCSENADLTIIAAPAPASVQQ